MSNILDNASVIDPSALKPGSILIIRSDDADEFAITKLLKILPPDVYVWITSIDGDLSSLEEHAANRMGWFRVPDSHTVLPSELTAENGAKKALSGEFKETVILACEHCDSGVIDGEFCEECGGAGDCPLSVPISWVSIKDIYRKVVGLFEK